MLCTIVQSSGEIELYYGNYEATIYIYIYSKQLPVLTLVVYKNETIHVDVCFPLYNIEYYMSFDEKLFFLRFAKNELNSGELQKNY